MRISPNFTLHEMMHSPTAKRLGFINQIPGPVHTEALRRLCTRVLQPIRDHFKQPVRVNSGYRSPKLNKHIGGSKFSQHMLGEAADIEIPGMSNLMLAKWITGSDIQFDQLILEHHDPHEGQNDGWVHVSYAMDGEQRGMVLTAIRVEAHTSYVPGLRTRL